MIIQGAQSIGAGGIANTDFLGKCGDGGIAPAIIVTEGVENVEGILGLLAIVEGTELESQERTNFTNSGGELLIGSVEINTGDFDGACGG
ncbi:MAG: hypothetical protein NTZ94_01515 [Verrucomicrobia bacterium]|nr:hypothetical protein [Verrucomicrobiota bacterium]